MYGSIHNESARLHLIRFQEEQSMKADNCVAFTDAGGMGLTNRVTEPGNEHEKYGFIVPAGAMIGLGLGFFVGHAGTGVLVGVGLGLLASGLIPVVKRPLEGEGLERGGVNVTMLLIGAFMIFVGISLALAPAVLWPYAIPGFFILLGIWSLVRGFYQIA